MDVHDYCEARAAPAGSSLRCSLLSLSLAERQAVVALHALQRELQDCATGISEPAVARHKLDWWREELGRLQEDRPRHPATQALAARPPGTAWPADLLAELAEAAAMDLEYGSYPSLAQLLVYCHRGGSSLALLKARALGQRQSGTAAFAHEVGVMLVLARQLLGVRWAARAGRCYIPLDELERFGVRFEDLLGSATDARLRALFAFQLQRVREYHNRALARLPDADRYAQRSQLMLAELLLAALAELENDGLQLLERQLSLTPIRKFWLAWRALRRERRRRTRHMRSSKP